MGNFLQDIRYASRVLRRSPGFAAAAMLSLALGVGANTAIFSLIDAVLLRMLPVKHPEQLVLLRNPGSEGFSYAEFQQLRDRNTVFSGMFAFRPVDKLRANLNGQTEIATGQLVSGNYYSVLGVNAVLGRTSNTQDESAPGGNPVAVITHGFWERRFARDPSVVGRTIRLNGNPFTIIGVTPADFFGVTPDSPADISVPLTMQAQVLPGRSWLQGHGPRRLWRRWWFVRAGSLARSSGVSGRPSQPRIRRFRLRKSLPCFR